MTRVKICGVTNAADRDAAVAAGADALGFIVDVPVDTPREISPARAADLAAGVPPLVSTVVVTIADGPDEVVALLDRVGADVAQVHGDLSPADLRAVADESGRRVVTVVDPTDEDPARYDGAADALLVDSPAEADRGGTGRTHDWAATRDLREAVDVPVILAGGLTPENVAEAVRTVEPFGVDVASGVEREGGAKDHDAVRSFVENATRAPEAVSR